MLSSLYLSIAFSHLSNVVPARPSVVQRSTILAKSFFDNFIEDVDDLNHAWVLVINKNTNREGIYMLQVSGTMKNYVLGFEEESDAKIFADDLRKSYYSFEPVKWSSERLKSFCEKSENEMRIVPFGELMTPPEKNNLLENDDYEMLKIALENMYPHTPEDCDGDDCCDTIM